MIRELLIGTAVLGGGGYFVATNYASADIVRTVNATPHNTWRGFDTVLNAQRMTSFAESSEPSARNKLKAVMTSVDSKEIDFRLVQEATEVLRIHVRFEPLAGGNQTKVMLDADVSPLRGGGKMLGGDMMLRKLMGEMTEKLADEIEHGKLVQSAEAFIEMQRQIDASPYAAEAKRRETEYKAREAQTNAARPQMNPVGMSVRPMDPTPRN